MPNWCMNDVTLYNEDVSKVDALEEHLKKAEDMENTEAEGFANFLRPNPSGEWDYGWSCENWGTKWDPNPEFWTRDGDNSITIVFDSAWSPPTELYDYLIEEEGGDWSVSAYYYEPGMAFAGTYDNGAQDHYDIDFEDENWRDNMDPELVEWANLDDEYENWKEWQEEEEDED
jgi:hypothetical protein